MTPRQLFRAAYNRATAKGEAADDMRVLSRLSLHELIEMEKALAEHYRLLMRDKRETVDLEHPIAKHR